MSELSDRELLVRIDERTQRLHDEVVGDRANPGLKKRVDDIEATQDRAKGWIAGIIAGFSVMWSFLEWFLHRTK